MSNLLPAIFSPKKAKKDGHDVSDVTGIIQLLSLPIFTLI
jgi:hypothetical protein